MYPAKIYSIEVSKEHDLLEACKWIQNLGHSIASFNETVNHYHFIQTDMNKLKDLGYNDFIRKPITESINFIISKRSPQSSVAVAVC
jgi:hypothetical protein